MRMMSEIEEITGCLPGLDCGSCGAPKCMAFAEDIVKNETTADECTVIMRELFHEYIQEKKHESILERLKPIQKQNKETGGEST